MIQKQYYSKDLQNQVEKKFGKKDKIIAKGRLDVPVSPEREYGRVCNDYMAEFQKILLEELPSIRDDYDVEMKFRVDGFSNLAEKIDRVFERILKRFYERVSMSIMKKRIMEVAQYGEKLSIREWKSLVKKTLGVDITEDYYRGDMFKQLLEQWVDENVDLIKTIPQETLGGMKEKILEGYKYGRTTRELTKDIMAEYKIGKNHAKMIVRDQMSKLSGEITRRNQIDAGVTEYKWSTSKDSRVRDCHRSLDGKIFSWNDPPEMWYMTKKGRVYTGRRCHPQQDYQCRCCAIPVMDKRTIALPVETQSII